ncbi:TnsA endonuclease N-terminal domain-containing protein [Paenibacillus thiaminolyticus]|uniref:TnsA endonuclease N-terminal domain-containing protein n=1 Tax=Paenibacillus thiaminolyticus TaxID=49283 RepID=A0ABT4FPJ5_PANTH|nr:TnsA endonuclease N-terminal domain-containing protein [Paenibacillus thiaminolyticus]MCY9536296.1 TnsA endonuclease N-terminal domain-containing protein [Paenibacillus thiaminolyticus]MCY9604362.1 TnsA endonuclease N-terminal domain-containing protein [Paenibacillus thiaminolyticus]MCY9606074.1 TnsA endonuclease N-terminal domain-containing protein [Paenibacillus thiaminolyticus]MCY9615316.1 TnsA endonuclease N-terminal domain-containing protein [Paenibacillus thiaminolyticus]MCY9618012.1 
MIKKGQPQWKIEQRRLKEGRGQGHFADYQPYVKTYDFSSDGVRSRDLGWKSERIHHFMSRGEYYYYLVLEFSDRIVDIREQYPLLPKERTIEIANELNVPHPSDDNGDPVVMTTDFNITILGEKHPEDLRDVIRTVKPTMELTTATLQKLEIERRFFEEKGMDWGVVIDDIKPSNLFFNLDWIYDSYYLSAKADLNPNNVSFVAPHIFDAINNSEAPPSEKVTTVFHNGGRDLDYYLISDYNEVAIEKLIQQNDWRKIENSGGIVSDHINVYKKQIQNLHQEYERYEKLFLDNPVKFNHD